MQERWGGLIPAVNLFIPVAHEGAQGGPADCTQLAAPTYPTWNAHNWPNNLLSWLCMIFVVLSGSLRVNSLANARHFSHWVTRLKPRWACTHPHPASCINTLVVPGYPYSLCTQKCIPGACWI